MPKLVAPVVRAVAVAVAAVVRLVVRHLHQDRVALVVKVQLVQQAAAVAVQLKRPLKLVEPLAVTGGQANTIH
jgi:hypothetical protein